MTIFIKKILFAKLTMKDQFKLLLVSFFIVSAFLTLPLEAKEFRVGVLYWSMNIPGQVAMRNGLEAEAARINFTAKKTGAPTVQLEPLVAGDGESGIKNQIIQMQSLINKKVDAIIVQPTDNAALSASLQVANSSNIPVIAYDQYISGGKLAAYRTSDNYQAGYLDGEYLSSLFPETTEIKIILVEYPHVSSTVERVNGFIDALKKRKYRILKSFTAVEPVAGKKAALSILNDYPTRGSVDAIFTVNDGGGLSVVNELSKAGRNEIKIATIDGDPLSIENIKAKRLTVIDSAQFCGPLGSEAMKAAYLILTNQKTPYHALIPVFPITTKTIHRYPGWKGPIPENFKKPWTSDTPEWTGKLKVIKP